MPPRRAGSGERGGARRAAPGAVYAVLLIFSSSSPFTAIAIFIANFTAHPLLSFPTRPCVSEGGLFPSLPPPPNTPPFPLRAVASAMRWVWLCTEHSAAPDRCSASAAPPPQPPLPAGSRGLPPGVGCARRGRSLRGHRA